jgi:RTX calcium-binding nonapeptide repeat (4 copies)
VRAGPFATVTPVRLRLAVALAVALVAAPAGAVAAIVAGTNHADRLVGTPKADTLDGRGGNDTLLGLGGNDLLIGGIGHDTIFGGPGSDAVAANGDATRDAISCGAGKDIINADPGDSVAADCEVVSRQLSTDTVSGGGGQHATEVEPDSFAFGNTVVAVFQVGRIENGGATAIGVATSIDGGGHWRSGLLPAVTTLSPAPGPDPRASDPSIAFDAAHGVWLAATLGIAASQFQLLVSRSPDGIAWRGPITVRAGQSGSLDKEWIACDNWPSSPNRGHCYLSYLDVGAGIIATQTTTDAGATWGTPVATSFIPSRDLEANGAQPLPRPDGSLVVVYEIGGENGPSLEDEVLSATSTDGGATFAASVHVSNLTSAAVPGLRAPPLPSADVAADGRLFVTWHDCLTERPCVHDRILLSTTTDGQTWSAPTEIAPTKTGMTQFVPGLAVDPATSGSAQHLAVAYYSLTTACPPPGGGCPWVDVWLVTSSNGGATWSAPQRLDAEPMHLDWLPLAGGRFLGDYISTSYVAGKPIPVFSLAVQPWGGKQREAIMALQPR